MWQLSLEECPSTTLASTATVQVQPGVYFINVLLEAFAHEDPKSVKNTVKSLVSFYPFSQF